MYKTSEQLCISPIHFIFRFFAIYIQSTWKNILWKMMCIRLMQHHFEYMLTYIHAYVYTYTYINTNILYAENYSEKYNISLGVLVLFWSIAVHWRRIPLVLYKNRNNEALFGAHNGYTTATLGILTTIQINTRVSFVWCCYVNHKAMKLVKGIHYRKTCDIHITVLLQEDIMYVMWKDKNILITIISKFYFF